MTSFIPWYIFDAFRLIQSKVSRFESKFYLFLDTHLLISLYSLSEVVCLTSSFYHQTLWSSHQRRLFDPTESMWRRPKSKTSLFLNTHPVILISIWWSPFALSLLFVTSPCESRDEILFKGVVLSHSKIFNFGLWVSFRMCLAIFRVFREFSRFFLKLFSFSCELISFIWMALKYFSRVSNILFGLLYPELSSAIVGKFSDLRIIFSGV